MNFVEELKWRGMLHNITPGTEDQLGKEMTSGYIGFDPTAASLTVGNLVTIMMLVHLQRAGHKPYALVGGATGMVGDPSGKSNERNLLDEETLRHNQACVRKQLEHFLDFDCGPNSAEMVNNYDWFSEFKLLDFLRDVGKHITISYMAAKDSVKTRMETGISYTEFAYQLIQGYDFYHLWKNEKVFLQMGGSDQWGNITTGTELIRRMGGGSAFAVTTPLLTKADGTKFGKSESGNIWLDPAMTSPYRFYQFWLRASDADVVKYAKIFSTKPIEELQALIEEHEADENKGRRILQRAIAEEITEKLHGAEALEKAVKASRLLFSKNPEDMLNFSVEELKDVFEGVPTASISREDLDKGIPVLEFLNAVDVFSSNGEARRSIQQGGVRFNLEKWDDPSGTVTKDQLFGDQLIWVKNGKKKNHIIYVE